MTKLANVDNLNLNSVEKLSLFIDGAARGNPGHAGIGILLLKDDHDLIKKGFYLGIKTNNQAEYLALLIGLLYALQYTKINKLAINHIDIYTDSQLLVRQLTGQYRVKNPILLRFYKEIELVLKNLNYKIYHIYREKNKQADQLANDGIDKKIELPSSLKEYLSKKELF